MATKRRVEKMNPKFIGAREKNTATQHELKKNEYARKKRRKFVSLTSPVQSDLIYSIYLHFVYARVCFQGVFIDFTTR